MAETYFKKTFKGYDPQQVDEFIISLSDTYEKNEKELSEQIHALESETERLKGEIAELNQNAEDTLKEHQAELLEKQKEYDELCAEIGEKMVVADSRAAEIIKNAEKEAALITSLARQNSENEAKAIRLNAEAEAERIIQETRQKCDSIAAAAEEFRIRQKEMTRSLSETESRFASALNKLREDIGIE
ncbi:MAG: DivIVA domain-containing protein [Clostridia bacterium]|nr:DivIVA domain-containing protein [Clostridia bacterium]